MKNKMSSKRLGCLAMLIGMLILCAIPVQAMTNLSMKKGTYKNVTVPLSIYQLDKGLGYGLYNWHSSNSKVASVTGVSPIGRIKAKKNGTCIITAQCHTPYPGAYHAWKVTVGGKGGGTNGNTTTTVKKVTVKSVKLNKTKLTLNVGKSQTLKYTISPKKAKTTVSWSSSNTSVASVSGGKVYARKPGKTTITVKTANGKKKSCKVTVKAPAAKVTMSSSFLTYGKGEKFKLKATVYPGNTTDKLKWSTSNKKIATVNSNGMVTAKKGGRVTITAKCGSKKATCSIKVAPNKIKKINPVNSSVEIAKGSAALLKYSFTPSNADGMLTWSSSNTNVVKVDQNGKATAVSTGTATVTVKSTSGASARYTIKVTIPATGVDVTTYVHELEEGKGYQFKASASPYNTTDRITWSSDNSSIAKVSSSGYVTAVKPGTTYIWAHAGGYSNGIKLEVIKKPPVITNLQVSAEKTSLNVGNAMRLKCYAYYGTQKEDVSTQASWYTSNSAVMYVNGSGYVEAKAEGTVTITAYYRGKSASYLLKVTEDADISKGSISIYNGYYTQDTAEGEIRVDYNASKGIRIIQSTSVTNDIWLRESAAVKLVLAGVEIAYIMDSEESNLVVELETGTANYIMEGGIRVGETSDITICGSGTLYTDNYGPSLRGGMIKVLGGNVIARTQSEYGSAILGYEGFSIGDGAHVTDKCYLPNYGNPTEEEKAMINAGRLTIASNQ